MRKLAIILGLLLISTLNSGCVDNKYDKFYKDFSKLYFQIVESVDIQNTYVSLQNLHKEEVISKINSLEKIINDIKDDVPENNKEQYSNYKKWLAGLKFLNKSYEKWDQLTNEELSRIDIEIGLINVRKDNSKE